MTFELAMPHTWSGATTLEERVCTCMHGYDEDHIFRGSQLVCTVRGCSCRDFQCGDHSADVQCWIEPVATSVTTHPVSRGRRLGLIPS